MIKKISMLGIVALTLSVGSTSFANIPTYLNESEYHEMLNEKMIEDKGIVVENNLLLGYITYRNSKGRVVTYNYYPEEVVVEKQPYYEMEDKIGYIDELFPYFKYDARDTTISNIKAGDCIYLRLNADEEVTYISAYNDYIVRYGKVNTFQYNTSEGATLLLEDEEGGLYSYEVGLGVPVTKGGASYGATVIKPGAWVKVLVNQKILGEGIIEEEVMEIVVDNDTRTISNLYRGTVTSIDVYRGMLNLKNAQALGKLTWGSYKDLLRLNMDTKNAEAYLIGNQVSVDYINRNLKNAAGYVYVAAENYKGKENAVKLNFQSKLQTTLQPSTVIYTSPNMIKLLSGETIHVAKDAIIVRDDRLVEAHNIMVGDTLQAVITGENKLAVGNVSSDVTTGSLEIFRGRIKKISDSESFQFETFSLLSDNTWYYHPTPRTFSIDHDTKFYNEEGYVEGGIDKFLAYGEDSHMSDVYTVVAIGEKAYMIVEMPYATDAVKGMIYSADDEGIKIKDVYYYHTKQKKWLEYSKKNVGATITLAPHTIIIKNGKVISPKSLEKGDMISAMIETSIKDTDGSVPGYIIVVEN